MMTPERLLSMLQAAMKDPSLSPMAADALEEAGYDDAAASVRSRGAVTTDTVWAVSAEADIPHKYLPLSARTEVWRTAGLSVLCDGDGRIMASDSGGRMDRALMIALSRGHEGIKAVGAALDILRESR